VGNSDPNPVSGDREADAAMISINDEVPTGFSYIARTTWGNGDEHDYRV